MSIDIELLGEPETSECRCSQCGHLHEHTTRHALFEAHLTGNLARMAAACGLYSVLWRPDELSPQPSVASDLLPRLMSGLQALREMKRTGELNAYEPANGCGSSYDLERVAERLIDACVEFPNAIFRTG